MSDSVFASRLTQLTKASKLRPYSKVILWYDDDNAFISGDDSGQTLEAEFPWATQDIADKMLSKIKGHAYAPFNGKRASIDPAAELGDGVTVGGIYGPLASMECLFDAMSAVDIAAPSGDEMEDEGTYKDKIQRNLSRKVTLGASYYGTRITRANGLEITKTAADGTEKSRVKLNSDLLAFYNDDGAEALYFDAAAGKFKFCGLLNVADNFLVDADGNVTINGNINLSGGSITWGSNLPSSGISASRCRTIITEELVSAPEIRAASDASVYATMVGDALALRADGVTNDRALLEATDSYVRLVLGVGTSTESSVNGRMCVIKDTSGASVFYTTSKGVQVGFDLTDSTVMQMLCPICLDSDSYGYSLPSSGTTGQIFFLLS